MLKKRLLSATIVLLYCKFSVTLVMLTSDFTTLYSLTNVGANPVLSYTGANPLKLMNVLWIFSSAAESRIWLSKNKLIIINCTICINKYMKSVWHIAKDLGTNMESMVRSFSFSNPGLPLVSKCRQ